MAQENQEIDLKKWFFKLLKNWYWFVLCGVLFGVFGLYYYYSHTYKFVVDGQIMLRSSEADPMSFIGSDMLRLVGMGGSKSLEDEIAIMTSRDMFDQIIRELDLRTEYRKKKGLRWVGQYPSHDITVNYPQNFLDTAQWITDIYIKARKNDYLVKVEYGKLKSRHVVTDLAQVIPTCACNLSFTSRVPVLPGDAFKVYTQPRLIAIDSYKQSITAAPLKKDSKIILLSEITDMPRRSINFINRMIELYNQTAAEDKKTLANATADFINERLLLLEKELSTAEIEVENYKEKYGIVDLASEAGLFLKESAEYRKQAVEVETQLNLVQSISELMAKDTQHNNLIPANLGIADVALVELINSYNQLLLNRMRVQRTATEENPVLLQMDSQLALLRENIISTISSVQSSLMIAKKDIDARFVQLEKQRSGIPSQEREYVRAERDRQIKEALYLFLYQKREENTFALSTSVVPTKTLAIPQVNPIPVAPRLKVIGLFCIFLAFCFPCAGIILFELLNNKISDDPKEFVASSSLPSVGCLLKNTTANPMVFNNQANSVAAEFVRSLRTNVNFAIPSQTASPTILITSCDNGEGKSYVATNLAVSLSLLNKKVALVELDLRHPSLAEFFNTSSQGHITSYLAGETNNVDDLIISTEYNHLDIILAGSAPANPSELLYAPALNQLFASLRERYDYIIVDSSALMLVGDTFLLADKCDMTLVVSRANHTTKDMLTFVEQLKEQNRLPNIHTVLNDVNPKTVVASAGLHMVM